MPVSILTDQFNELVLQFRVLHKKARRNSNPSVLHDLRVSYKKLDAFHLWCLCFMEPKHAVLLENWFKRLAPLYKKAGKVRTAHLLIKNGLLVGLWTGLPELKGEMNEKLSSRREAFDRFVKKHRFPTTAKVGVIVADYNETPKKKLKESRFDLALRNQKEALTSLAAPAGEHWHAARRLLKTNFYLMLSLKGHKNIPFSRQRIEQWGHLEKTLGKWHDLTVLLYYLKSHNLQEVKLPAALVLQIKELEEEVVRETLALAHSI